MSRLSAVFLALAMAGAGFFTVAQSPNPSASPPSSSQASQPGLQNLSRILPVIGCDKLTSVDISSAVGSATHITSAHEIQYPNAPYCDVKGYVEKSVQFEVKLPSKTWTQRYVQLGCGGLCGNLNVQPVDNSKACAPSNKGELVLASTDMGHKGQNDGSWAAQDSQLKVDFAYRGVHTTALAAKAIIKAFYGQDPKFSYFSGCSDGGREALAEAQRYPDDFNGITAGAAAMNFTTLNSFYHAWSTHVNQDPSGKAILTASKTTLLHQAALNACDASDGLKDGLISVPWKCQFDPSVLACSQDSSDIGQCLTADELRIVREIYKGAHDDLGNKLTIAGPLVGSELRWGGVTVPQSADQQAQGADHALSAIKYLLYPQNPPSTYTLDDFEFTQQTFNAITQLRGLYDATSTNLNQYAYRGGKLIMWHGLADTDVSPLNSVAYYNSVQRLMGADRTDQFLKLYLLPEVGHCGGGNGSANVDFLSAIMAWVETGKAPDRLLASHVTDGNLGTLQGDYQGSGGSTLQSLIPQPQTGTVDRTRPIYPYPYFAQYKGQGNIDNEKNFTKSAAIPVPAENLKWLGSDFYGPDNQLWCSGRDTDLNCGNQARGIKKTPQIGRGNENFR